MASLTGQQYTTNRIETRIWSQAAISSINFDESDTDVERRYDAHDTIKYTFSREDINVVVTGEEGLSHCCVEFRKSYKCFKTERVAIGEISEAIEETLRYVSFE
jgi:hypothetical protein